MILGSWLQGSADTNDAIGRGELVGLFSGNRTGRARWGARAFWGGPSRTRWEDRSGGDEKGPFLGLF